jgi:signal transduction histidine kinase
LDLILIFLILKNITSNRLHKQIENLICELLLTYKSWKTTLVMILSGIYLAFYTYQSYVGNPVAAELYDLKLIVNQIIDREQELEQSLKLKYEFLRNLEHEAHTPITGITSMGQVLFEKYKKLTEEQRLKGLEEIAKSSERLATLVNNLIDLSKLSSMKYELNKKKVNLSYLVYSSLDACTKMYLNGKELEFVTNIEDNITVTGDKYYIKQTLDNPIINAISYPEDGPITVNLKRDKDTVEFSNQDEGIGIPIEELIRIFAPFTFSSKTRTPSSGRYPPCFV